MKKSLSLIIAAFLITLSLGNAAFAFDDKDTKNVIKIVKKINRLSDKHKIDEIGKYYSEKFVSFDGLDKKQTMEVYRTAGELYPKSKTRETILKVEEINDTLKVYIDENSIIKMEVSGDDAIYAADKVVKGIMVSNANYAIIFKKEDGIWKIIGDEIFNEETAIRYGEAMEAGFSIETPDNIVAGEEFTVKTILKMPENRYVVGSIGHDKITFPPAKYFDPYRNINSTGILERVMIANKEGKNEYANATFAYITPVSVIDKKTKKEFTRVAIVGMGIQVKRINVAPKEEKAL